MVSFFELMASQAFRVNANLIICGPAAGYHRLRTCRYGLMPPTQAENACVQSERRSDDGRQTGYFRAIRLGF